MNELREVAKEWDEDERQKRLGELRTKRLNMSLETEGRRMFYGKMVFCLNQRKLLK